jgi:alkylation response protein AidB-like acyl-CoA dehydrogenase
MDFSLSPEHLMAEKMVRDFALKEIAPVIKEADRKQEPIPWAIERMGALGILGMCFPIRYGGQGMDYLAWGLACEELEAVDTSLRVVMSVHTGLCGMTVFQWGTEDQKQRLLGPLASGEKIGCGAFTEPGMGSDVAAMTTSARRMRHPHLNGEKMDGCFRADLALVTVKTDPHPKAIRTCPVLMTCTARGQGDPHLWRGAGATGWPSHCGPIENRSAKRQGRRWRLRPWALHCGLGRDRHHPRLPRGQCEVRHGAPDLWCADRRAPAHPGEDRPHVARL